MKFRHLKLGCVGCGVLVISFLEGGDLGLGFVPLVERQNGHFCDVGNDALIGHTAKILKKLKNFLWEIASSILVQHIIIIKSLYLFF